MQAIKRNRTFSVITFARSGVPFAYAKTVDDVTPDSSHTGQEVQLGSAAFEVAIPASPAPLADSVLGYTPLTAPDHKISFDARGLPCEYDSTNQRCVTYGFVYYSHDTMHADAWSAVSVSPGGRVKQWFWNGSSWAD
jgi:hypothetical protein